jgi:hypothetical protein
MQNSVRTLVLGLLALPLVALLVPRADAFKQTPSPSISTLLSSPVAPLADKEADAALEAAVKVLRRASGRDGLPERLDALKKVVDLNHPDSMGELTMRLGIALSEAGKAEHKLENDRIMLERRRVQLAELELMYERNKDLAGQVNGYKKEVEILEKEVAGGEAAVALEVPWRDELRKGATKVLMGQGEGKRRDMVKQIWKDFDSDGGERQRLAAAWILLDLGDSGTTVHFAKAIMDVLDEHRLLKREMPKIEADLRDRERRIREAAEKGNGMYPKSLQDDYEQVLAQASQMSDKLLEMSRFAEDLASSAAKSIGKEADPKDAIDDVLKLSRKSPFQKELIEIIAQSNHPEAPGMLMKELDKAKESYNKQMIVDALAELGALEASEAWMINQGLVDKEWNLRSSVVRALAKLRSRAAVPAMIDQLEIEEGRVRTDIGEALKSLTGRNFRSNVDQWRKWYDDNKDTFEVPIELPKSTEEEALEKVGMTFFGLRTESQKVLFVLDVSGSMDFPMRTYTNDKENSGETRISVAKRELLQALAGIREGGMFNIVLYSNDVWSWSDEPVVMSVETRAEVTTFVEELTVMGGTNLYGAIKGGLDACRGEARRKDVGTPKWITPVYDTIFLLSDGAPSVGISTDREDILDMAAEENSDLSVTINSIGLSSEQDAILMRRLAEQTGGKYVAR